MPVNEVEVTNEEPRKKSRNVSLKRERAEPVSAETPSPRTDTEFDPYAKASPLERKKMNEVALFQQRRDNQTIKDWLAQLGDRPVIQIQYSRTKPDMWKGRKANGYLKTYDYIPTDEELKETWGGGTFVFKVSTPNSRGQMVYTAQTILDIAGDPIIPSGNDDDDKKNKGSSMQDPIVARAWNSMEERQKQLQEEISKARETPQRSNLAEIEAFMAPMRDQVKMLADQNARLQAQLAEGAKPKEDPMRDRIFEKMVSGADDRLSAVRIQHESEIRTMKESHAAEMRGARESADRDKDFLMRSHERSLSDLKESFNRELANTKALHENMLISSRSAADTSKEIQKAQIDTLTARNRELESEIKELRAKKDQSLTEKISEINTLKDALGGDHEEKGIVAQVTEAVVASDKAGEILGRIFGPSAPAAAQPQQVVQAAIPQQQAPQQPRRPRMVRQKATGQVFAETQEGLVPVHAQKEDGTTEEVFTIDPAQVKLAVGALEMACRNRTDPANFATSARQLVPEAVMRAIQRDGVDGFLSKVAQLEVSSPLNTQEGRNWIRKVSKHLVGEGR